MQCSKPPQPQQHPQLEVLFAAVAPSAQLRCVLAALGAALHQLQAVPGSGNARQAQGIHALCIFVPTFKQHVFGLLCVCVAPAPSGFCWGHASCQRVVCVLSCVATLIACHLPRFEQMVLAWSAKGRLRCRVTALGDSTIAGPVPAGFGGVVAKL